MDETRNHFLEEIKKKAYLMRKKPRKGCMTLDYSEELLILVSGNTICVSVSAFALSAYIFSGIASASAGLKIYVNNAEIKKY